MAEASTEGYLALALSGVAVSLLGWGSFTLPMKNKAVQDANLHPLVFNVYMGLGVALSSLPILLIQPFAWTWWSTAGAALFAPGSLFCVLTVEWIGIAKGQAIWAGCVALQSFLCGLIGFQEYPQDFPMTIVGLVTLLAGIGSLAFVEPAPVDAEDQGQRKPLIDAAGDHAENGEAYAPAARADKKEPQLIKGLFGCVMIGLLAGSCMVPFRLSPQYPFQDGINSMIYAVGFGVSLAVINILILCAYCMVEVPPLHLSTCFLPGLLSGVLWNMGNIGVIFACLPPLGLAVGYPLTQCCLLIAGLWGILFYGEIRGAKAISTFFGGAAVVITGACLLGIYGQAA